MTMVKLLLAMGSLGLAAPAQASPPMPRETVDAIATAVRACTGSWVVSDGYTSRTESVATLAPRVQLLTRPSTALNSEEGEDLYTIAKGLLVPATGAPDWMLDGGSGLNCPGRPAEAVALLRYLVGEEPDEWRGTLNAFEWLGLAYETGVSGSPDPVRARRYYLLARMHMAIGRNDRWSDGKDKDLAANVGRAGLRPFLDALAKTERAGGAARMILAEEALPADPIKARKLLRTLFSPALVRLVKLESEGRLPVVADAEDIAFWAEAWRTQIGHPRWAGRLLKGVQLVNGGVIPTASERPAIDSLRSALDRKRSALAEATRGPVPVRVLVDPTGRAIYAEGCRSTALAPGGFINGAALNAARLYDLTKLPPFPIARGAGRPVYGWVILPAVHFRRPRGDKLEIDFVDLPAERCAFSATAEAL